MNVFGPNRMVFGTDAPTFSFLYSEREWVNMIRDLPTKAPEGIKFVPAEVEAVLHLCRDLGQGQHLHPRGCQQNAQGHAFDQAADANQR